MPTFRKGTDGAPTAAKAMAEHLREQTIPEEMVAKADYYLRGVTAPCGLSRLTLVGLHAEQLRWPEDGVRVERENIWLPRLPAC